MLDKITELYEKHCELLNSPSLTVDELENAFAELQATTGSKEFRVGIQDGTISIEAAAKLKRLEDSIQDKLEQKKVFRATNLTNGLDLPIIHDPGASKLMENADDLYWQGKWKDAYDIYEKVLQIEPNWERAKTYLEKAKQNYANGVGLPNSAIPSSVKLAFARAESALSRREWDRAKAFIDDAYAEAEQYGVSHWDELNDLRSRIEINRDIHKSYQAAISIPDIDDAIGNLENIYRQTLDPSYKQKLDELTQVRSNQLRKKFHEGLKLSSEGRFVEAINIIEDVISRDPKNSEFLTGLASVQSALNDYAEHKALIQNAKLEIQIANFEKAIELLKQAKKVNAYTSNELNELMEVSQTALKFQQKYYELMGRGRQHLDSEDFQSAILVFQEANTLVTNTRSDERILLAEDEK